MLSTVNYRNYKKTTNSNKSNFSNCEM